MAVVCAAADWLKGLQNDSRPEVASAARELYADRFPYAARNERKKQLQISHMEFAVCGEVFDEYGDGCYRELQFTLDRKEHAVWLRQGDETAQVTLTIKEMRKLLNVIVNNYEILCWEEDYGVSEALKRGRPLGGRTGHGSPGCAGDS